MSYHFTHLEAKRIFHPENKNMKIVKYNLFSSRITHLGKMLLKLLDHRIWNLIWKLGGNWSKGFEKIYCKEHKNSCFQSGQAIAFSDFHIWAAFHLQFSPPSKCPNTFQWNVRQREKEERCGMVWWNTCECFAQII